MHLQVTPSSLLEALSLLASHDRIVLFDDMSIGNMTQETQLNVVDSTLTGHVWFSRSEMIRSVLAVTEKPLLTVTFGKGFNNWLLWT